MTRTSFCPLLITLFAAGLMATPIAADSKTELAGSFYRYRNAEGVKVLSHSIPPEFSQSGYEILNASGRVIKVVPPALTPEAIKAGELRRILQEEYTELARRYSGPKDIENAKQRQLERLGANVALTKGTLNNLKRQGETLTSKAASFERANKPIPADVLEAMKKNKTDIAAGEAVLVQREKERQAVIDRFEREKDIFIKGTETFKPNAKLKTPASAASSEAVTTEAASSAGATGAVPASAAAEAPPQAPPQPHSTPSTPP